ncbi:terminase large subunit [Mycobacterium phage Vincenzo]|uniref:Terminase n=2 Tax=Coopervirus vincenzo TaxID=1983110 RepID=A0A0F6SJI3_9CAUD|nr:terminase large subunit [Mycobacterium phage Vincenzo]AKF14267.1 terminase [Mycobacterium phage Vincenzo]AKF14670.1 terminase [Mycobacterium phage AlanGrant]
MAKKPELEFPDHGSGDPAVAVWQSDGTFDTQRAEQIFEETKDWPPEQRAAMLRSLRAAETRATVRTKYRHPAEMAAAVTPGYRITPALAMISNSIERVLNSHRKINLSVSMPPQEGKSSLCSVWAPLRALQLNPNRRIILATYAQPLADMHSRSARDVINAHGAGLVDPLTGLTVEDKIGLRLAQGANKISFWGVEGGAGGLLAAGIGATITGMPADLLIIDDPFKNMMEADSATHRNNVELWFSSVALTRLAPDASIILIQCMTGDTPVLRPDGTETPLADIRPGDEIATYEDGALSTATVKNWASQGYDRVSKLVFASGRQVRANARHPFLVAHDDGTTEWIRLADLKPGHRVIATSTGANDPTTPEDGASRIGLHCGAPSEDYGFTPRDTGVNGPASSALLTAATSPPSSSRGCATATMTSTDGRLESGTPRTVGDLAATCCCAGDTASTTTSTTACSPPKTGGALSAALRLTRRVCQRIGTAISAWITTRRPACANCFATTAMSASEGFTTTPHGSALLPTISTDTLLHIEPDGIAEVFDIEVERTENFIANGLVSHNTRWHPEDLAGKVLEGERLLDREERTWRHLNIPAIAEEGIPDALGRPYGEPMVSARDTPEAKRNFAQTRKQVGERTWYALYQGSPRNPAGGIFQRAWFDPRLPQPPSYPVAAVVGIDPADSGEGDDAGVVGGSLYHDGKQSKVALTHDRSGKFTSDQWARQGVILALEIGARVVAVEGYTAAKTYTRVVRQAYTAIHNEAIAALNAGAELTAVQKRALPDIPPFIIKPWRGASKADAVARSGGLSQSLETGRCRTVEGALAVFENQACDWQPGQHQPDRVAASIIVHDTLMEMAGQQMHVAAPVQRKTAPPPAWMRRSIGKG